MFGIFLKLYLLSKCTFLSVKIEFSEMIRSFKEVWNFLIRSSKSERDLKKPCLARLLCPRLRCPVQISRGFCTLHSNLVMFSSQWHCLVLFFRSPAAKGNLCFRRYSSLICFRASITGLKVISLSNLFFVRIGMIEHSWIVRLKFLSQVRLRCGCVTCCFVSIKYAFSFSYQR
jgi:hypothetical protein